jgi:hypothetical protein
MLHQPRTALAKAATELPTIKPWYETSEAKTVLADCVESPPARHLTATRDVEAGEMPAYYAAHDRKVMMLGAIKGAYFEAVEQLNPELLRATRYDIGVTEAIDLAIEAAKNAAATGSLRDSLLAQGLPLGEVNRLVAAAEQGA